MPSAASIAFVEGGAAWILQSIQKLVARSQPEDAIVLYFAGHGIALGDRFYFVPHDLGYAGRQTELRAKDLDVVTQHSISDAELEAAVEGLDAGQFLLVIDACNSGQALEAEEKRRGPMNSCGLAQLAYEKGMYILTAAQSYQAALETAELGHGYLTFALIEEGLKKNAADYDPTDGQIVAREWFGYAVDRVPQMQDKQRAARLFVQKEADGFQTPRLFYRRETDPHPFVVGKQQP